ncbi:MAG: metallophosphoesterase [Spirochaetaceae bacterium]|nr:MAG: metallophosphoesterase [Spirochaetaceae bacterium]
MRYAVVSDLHSNLEALDAVARQIKTYSVDKILCLGDVVGYNADPQACISWTKENAASIVRGNHDKAVAGLMSARYFNDYARDAVDWSVKSLSKDEKSWLKELPEGPVAAGKEIILCHGTPQDEDMYMESPAVATESFNFLLELAPDCAVCFFGHTHVPLILDSTGGVNLGEKPLKLNSKRRYLVNPGAVGQPRDGNPDAGFCVYDDEDRTITMVRVPYAVEEAQRKIMEKGLPEVLASRLSVGR